MGLLDFLFKKKPSQPTQPFRAQSVSLGELSRRAEDAKRAEVEKVLPEVEASTQRIRSGWGSLEKKTSGLAKRTVGKGIDGEKIALQSKEDFARRAEHFFKASRFPEQKQKDLNSFERFSREFEDTLHKLARALADNKYLFLFFKEDTEDIGRTINELNDETLTLKHSVESARKNSEKYALLLRRIGELQALREKNAEFEKSARAFETDLKAEEEKEKQARLGFEMEEKNAAQAKVEIAALDNDVWTAENDVTQLLAPLQRPFRKLDKLLESRERTQGAQGAQQKYDKELAQTLADYSGNVLLALERDEDAKRLNAACGELEKHLSDLGLDLKEAEKANAAADAARSGKVAGMARARREALHRKEEKSGALAPLERAHRALEDAAQRKQESALELKAAQAKLAENAAAIRLEKDAIDKAANSLFKLSLSE